MDNTLNVQQYIQQCIHKDPSDVDTILKAPPGQEEGVWKYEHVRQFCMQLNGLTLLLQVCSVNCPGKKLLILNDLVEISIPVLS